MICDSWFSWYAPMRNIYLIYITRFRRSKNFAKKGKKTVFSSFCAVYWLFWHNYSALAKLWNYFLKIIRVGFCRIITDAFFFCPKRTSALSSAVLKSTKRSRHVLVSYFERSVATSRLRDEAKRRQTWNKLGLLGLWVAGELRLSARKWALLLFSELVCHSRRRWPILKRNAYNQTFHVVSLLESPPSTGARGASALKNVTHTLIMPGSRDSLTTSDFNDQPRHKPDRVCVYSAGLIERSDIITVQTRM